MSIQTVFLYAMAWSLVAITPGPAVVCVMSQAARYGARAARMGVLGIQLGSISFFVCAGTGIAALLAASMSAFAILQIVGAGYLFVLGIRIICSSFRAASTDAPRSLERPPRRSYLVLHAFAVQVTNPKALLFVSALLPQFLDPHRPIFFQLVILLICTVLLDVGVLVSYAFLSERGMRSLCPSRLSAWVERTFGVALMVFGIRLFFWHR